MNKLGVILTGKDSTNFSFCPLLGRRIRNNIIPENDFQDSDDDENPIEGDNLSDETESDSYDLQVLRSLHQASFKDFSERLSHQSFTIPLPEGNQSSNGAAAEGAKEKFSPSAFVNILDLEGNTRLVQKTTICWFLGSGFRKMSNDRILRVRQLATFADTRKLIVNKVEFRNVVRIDDWCLFKILPDSKQGFRFLLGRVIQFKANSRWTDRTNRNRFIYEWKFGTADVGVNCTWYRFDGQAKKSKTISESGSKIAVFSHAFHPCDTYICSLPPPDIPSGEKVLFSQQIVEYGNYGNLGKLRKFTEISERKIRKNFPRCTLEESRRPIGEGSMSPIPQAVKKLQQQTRSRSSSLSNTGFSDKRSRCLEDTESFGNVSSSPSTSPSRSVKKHSRSPTPSDTIFIGMRSRSPFASVNGSTGKMPLSPSPYLKNRPEKIPHPPSPSLTASDGKRYRSPSPSLTASDGKRSRSPSPSLTASDNKRSRSPSPLLNTNMDDEPENASNVELEVAIAESLFMQPVIVNQRNAEIFEREEILEIGKPESWLPIKVINAAMELIRQKLPEAGGLYYCQWGAMLQYNPANSHKWIQILNNNRDH
ncbi:hypothetical protein OUZ56_018396 [Daphnia magna]|uniref:Uncharacterized protein n=1 Tax=Daphnia magna TaxID=35525 RepID=A0ABQ9Z9U4_9CRUS|nr:hypothetical protein OUZ56_018396 [Daphnia magna]